MSSNLHTLSPADQKPASNLEPSNKQGTSLQEIHSIEDLFKHHYTYICNTIYRYIPDRAKTEDVAQDLFAELWLKRDQIHIHTSVTAYLRKMAVTRALNYIRDTKKHQWDELDQPESDHLTPVTDPDIILRLEEEDVRRKLETAISALPEKCRIVFLLSRSEELSYAEIAEQLQISVKTVENQIGKALRLLREALGEHRG